MDNYKFQFNIISDTNFKKPQAATLRLILMFLKGHTSLYEVSRDELIDSAEDELNKKF